jgi:hypothetical protein
MTALATITRDFNGTPFVFREDGWFNMTKAAKAYGKALGNFWVAKDTRAYLEEVTRLEAASLKSSDAPTTLFVANKGRNPGTWAHPKLAVFFARWLDVRFAVWCDAMIDDILKGKAIARPSGLHEVVITKPTESAVMGDCLLLFRLSVIERIWPSLVCTIPFMKFTKENLGAFALGGMVIAVALSVGKKDLSDPRQVLCYKPDGGVAIDSIHDDGISYVGGATTWRSPDGVFHMSNLPCIAKRPPEPVSAGASESR